MTACDACGRPLDPDTAHPQHPEGCNWEGCDCPEVCADCCVDPRCALRVPEVVS